jgi:hypothetical protein
MASIRGRINPKRCGGTLLRLEHFRSLGPTSYAYHQDYEAQISPRDIQLIGSIPALKGNEFSQFSVTNSLLRTPKNVTALQKTPGIDHVFNHVCESIDRERLGDNLHARFEMAVSNDGVFGVAGYE